MSFAQFLKLGLGGITRRGSTIAAAITLRPGSLDPGRRARVTMRLVTMCRIRGPRSRRVRRGPVECLALLSIGFYWVRVARVGFIVVCDFAIGP